MVPPSASAFSKHKHLQRKNIAVTSWGLLVVFNWSKTIQCGERSLAIPVISIPGSPLCPVAAFSRMCKLVPASCTGPAFLIPKNGKLETLTYTSYVGHLRRLSVLAGYNADQFSGHSFRRGGASAAFKAGVPAELIRLHGDWHLEAYLRYLNVDMNHKLLVSKSLANLIQNFGKS